LPAGVRSLFRAALFIFVLTIVIGILNGIDVWNVPRDILMTHVHSGTLGWITLSVFGVAGAMLAKPGEDLRRMTTFAIVALSAYILAFGSVEFTPGVSIQRPIGGTLALVAIGWVFFWAVRAKRRSSYDVAEFGIVLSLGFLLFGAVLGVMLGLQIAGVEVVPPEYGGRLGESHPGAMVIGFVVLAAVAMIEWLLRDRPPTLKGSRAGMIQMLLFFVAGIVMVIGFLAGNEALIQLGVPLQIVGTVILLVRHRSLLMPSEWGPGVGPKLVRTAVVGLVAVVVLIAYLVVLLSGGAEFEELIPVLVAMDHVNFLLVMTSLIFAVLLRGHVVKESSAMIAYTGLVIGVVGFAIGILSDVTLLKRIFTPILGLALLHGIFTFLRAQPREAVPSGRQ
jgi:hypothetical protein